MESSKRNLYSEIKSALTSGCKGEKCEQHKMRSINLHDRAKRFRNSTVTVHKFQKKNYLNFEGFGSFPPVVKQ